MRTDVLKERIIEGKVDDVLLNLYGKNCDLTYQKARYVRALNRYEELFGIDNVSVFSVGGRSEICGSHSDHQHGKCLAATVNLDVISVCATVKNGLVKICSNDRKMGIIDVSKLDYEERDYHNSRGLVKGTLKAIEDDYYRIGGFNAYITSDVINGSGLSSSASFEVMIATIINGLYNRMEIDPISIAKYCQFAENVYFGKPSGLMDQLCCSIGGLAYIDFKTAKPKVSKINFDFTDSGYSLCVVDCKSSHAKKMDEFISIPKEIRDVATLFGKKYISSVNINQLVANVNVVRDKCGDRAFLRAMHVLLENQRADREKEALDKGDINAFLALVKESANSCYKNLQNIYSENDTAYQPLSLALTLSEQILADNGVCKVHGGGFGGTIQVFVKNEYLDNYKEAMERIFGADCFYKLEVRKEGCKQLF